MVKSRGSGAIATEVGNAWRRRNFQPSREKGLRIEIRAREAVGSTAENARDLVVAAQ